MMFTRNGYVCVPYAPRGKLVMEELRVVVKARLVLFAAIEVNGQFPIA
jgi:hypothetical protein